MPRLGLTWGCYAGSGLRFRYRVQVSLPRSDPYTLFTEVFSRFLLELKGQSNSCIANSSMRIQLYNKEPSGPTGGIPYPQRGISGTAGNHTCDARGSCPATPGGCINQIYGELERRSYSRNAAKLALSAQPIWPGLRRHRQPITYGPTAMSSSPGSPAVTCRPTSCSSYGERRTTPTTLGTGQATRLSSVS